MQSVARHDSGVIPLCEPVLGGNEGAYLSECLESNWVSSAGPFVDRFEREFATRLATSHSVVTCSGTAAIHVALHALGVGPGDEVLVPTFTFIASVNPIAYLGASPVLVDCEQETWNVDPELVVSEVAARAKSGHMPKAIVVVHLYGHPADLNPILEVADRHGIGVIEDATESLGATYRGKSVGTLGRIGCFSFNGNKIMTTGGGGMLVTEDRELARRARHLTTQARVPGDEYRHDEIGYNYRLTNIQAALGVAQLEQLESFVERKQAIAARYHRGLSDLTGVELKPEAEWANSTWWMYPVLIDRGRTGKDRTDVMHGLRDRNIESRPVWTPIHRMPMYASCSRLGGCVADEIFQKGLLIPCSSSLSVADQDRVIEALRECVG